jgi:hypothetical protein
VFVNYVRNSAICVTLMQGVTTKCLQAIIRIRENSRPSSVLSCSAIRVEERVCTTWLNNLFSIFFALSVFVCFLSLSKLTKIYLLNTVSQSVFIMEKAKNLL